MKSEKKYYSCEQMHEKVGEYIRKSAQELRSELKDMEEIQDQEIYT